MDQPPSALAPLSFHHRVVAWSFLVLGVVGVGITIAGFVFCGGIGAVAAWTSPEAPNPDEALMVGGLYMAMGLAFTIACGVLSVPSLMTGWGLLRKRPKAVPAAVAISALSAIFFFPVGTVIGAYAIWALCFAPSSPNTADLSAE